jgi:hypothetical protein
MKLRLCGLPHRIAILAAILGTCGASFSATNNHIISAAPTSINFGNQAVNTTAQSAITVTNSGSHALQIQNVGLSSSSWHSRAFRSFSAQSARWATKFSTCSRVASRRVLTPQKSVA